MARTSRYTRLHGHSFRVEATLRGPATPPVGWVGDLGALDAALKAVAGALDHGLLNETPGLESPTLEALCLHFAGQLKRALPRPRPHRRLPPQHRRELRAEPL